MASSAYDLVTDKIIEQLRTGVAPWAKSWNSASNLRPLRHNGEPYRGINVLLLWIAAAEGGFASPFWMTYKQAQEFGGQVRKGEKSTTVVYAGIIEKEDITDPDRINKIPFMKTYAVFNASQIDNLPEKYSTASTDPIADHLTDAYKFFTATGADIREGFNNAYYVPSKDYIAMPTRESFATPEDHASTLAHELIHWTGPKDRLNRYVKAENGTKDYALEELVAEIGAAFLGADLGIEVTPREDHASYIAHWLEILGNDKRAIFRAASAAEKATKFLHEQVNPTAVVEQE